MHKTQFLFEICLCLIKQNLFIFVDLNFDVWPIFCNALTGYMLKGICLNIVKYKGLQNLLQMRKKVVSKISEKIRF